VKRTGRNETPGVIIHICTETTGISLYSYLFFFYKIGEQESRTGFAGAGDGGWHWWEEGGGRGMSKRMTMVQIVYTNVCKCKNDTC
jgi:hypothetical protein